MTTHTPDTARMTELVETAAVRLARQGCDEESEAVLDLSTRHATLLAAAESVLSETVRASTRNFSMVYTPSLDTLRSAIESEKGATS